MGRAHSFYLRGRVYAAIEEGGSWRAAERRFGVSAATVVRQAQTGSLTPARQGHPAGSDKLSAYRDIVIAWVDAAGDVTLPKLAERLASERDIAVQACVPPCHMPNIEPASTRSSTCCWKRVA